MKPRSGENPPLSRSSRSRICRLVRSQDGKSLECALSSAAFSGSSLRSTSSPPCGATRWLCDFALSMLIIRALLYNERMFSATHAAKAPNSNHQAPNKILTPIFKQQQLLLEIHDWSFPRISGLGFGALSILHAPGAGLTSCHVGTTRDGLRFKNRRQRDLYAPRCCVQLGPQKFALADADGTRLLR